MADQITNYKCPACTGPLHFAGGSGKLECEYCGSIYSVEEIEKLYEEADKKAEAAKSKADEKAAEKSDEWEMTSERWTADGMKSYNCPSCGADLVCDDTTAASSCPYCGNPTIIPGQFSDMLKPDFVVPFKYEKDSVVKKLQDHYGNKFLLPKTFKDNNHIEEVKGVYVPFWLYDGTAAGSCGYSAEKSKTTTIGQYRVTKTKHYTVERKGEVSFEKIPADASSKMPDDLMDSIEPYDYKEMKPFSKAYLAGYLADKYDVTAEENAERALSRAKESTRRALRDDVNGYDSVTANYEDVNVEQGKVSYALMPVWLLNTKWEGKDYLFAMNGQTGRFVGDLPCDKSKLISLFIGILIAIAAASSLILDFSFGASVIAGLIISAIVCFCFYSSLKSVANAQIADSYISDKGVKITHRLDLYTHETEKREKIDNK